MPSRKARMIDLLVIVILLIIVAAVFIPMFASNRRAEQRLKDQNQLSGLMEGFLVWASNGSAQYPTPSMMDTANQTTPEKGQDKNTTSNVLSMMIFNGVVQPEALISPAETNIENVRLMRNYQFEQPSTAVTPSNGLWDPAFRATPIQPLRLAGGKVDASRTAPANQSYAYLVPLGKRFCMWSDTYSSTEAIISNRGPTYAASDAAPYPKDDQWTPIDGPLGKDSFTLLFYSRRGSSWRGHVAYNDNHVDLAESPTPPLINYSRAAGLRGKPTPDNLFVDESDDTKYGDSAIPAENHLNLYLRPIAEIIQGQPRVWRD